METEEFEAGVKRLLELAEQETVAIMCAEAVPWRCHRSLIADALVSRGWTVRHIFTPDQADPHRPTPFATIREGIVTYPAPVSSEQTPRLF